MLPSCIFPSLVLHQPPSTALTPSSMLVFKRIRVCGFDRISWGSAENFSAARKSSLHPAVSWGESLTSVAQPARWTNPALNLSSTCCASEATAQKSPLITPEPSESISEHWARAVPDTEWLASLGLPSLHIIIDQGLLYCTQTRMNGPGRSLYA